MALRQIPQQAVDLVKAYEGIPNGNPATVNIDLYMDPVGIWTIGWGHALVVDGHFLRGSSDQAAATASYPGGITEAQAETLLRGDLTDVGRDVCASVKVDINDNQFAALVSFAFNLGIANLRSSTLLLKLNDGDYAGAADQFGRWVFANGLQLPGLVRRRRAERDLFLT